MGGMKDEYRCDQVEKCDQRHICQHAVWHRVPLHERSADCRETKCPKIPHARCAPRKDSPV